MASGDTPDWSTQTVLPPKGELAMANRFYYTASGSVAAGTIGEIDVITVAAGYELQVSFLAVSSSASCIQQVKLREVHDSTAYAFFDSEYDVHGSWLFPDNHIYPVEAGQILQVHAYNNDTTTRTISFTIYGRYNEV